ncbi:MAG: hypothetical protein P8Q14_05185 [Vicingaceae bacterium]|nr:hypothetical protein [Vicingaceae bacterium]
MLKKLTYLIAVLAITSSGFSQPGETEEVSYVNEDTEYVSSFDSLDTKDKIHYGFEMGASFTNSNRYGDYFSTYYRPTISYDISPRFSLNTGLTYINSHVNNVPVASEYNYQLFSGNISQYNAFIGGEYKLTDRLIVGGSVFYDFTSYQSFDGQPVIKRNGLENIGYSGYFKYKVNDNFSIEGEIRINDRNPYNQNNRPFSNRSFGVGGSFFGR